MEHPYLRSKHTQSTDSLGPAADFLKVEQQPFHHQLVQIRHCRHQTPHFILIQSLFSEVVLVQQLQPLYRFQRSYEQSIELHIAVAYHRGTYVGRQRVHIAKSNTLHTSWHLCRRSLPRTIPTSSAIAAPRACSSFHGLFAEQGSVQVP